LYNSLKAVIFGTLNKKATKKFLSSSVG